MHRLPSFVPRSHEGNIFICRSKGFLDIYFIYKYLAGEDRGLWISIAWAPYAYTGPKNRHYTHRQLYFFSYIVRVCHASLQRQAHGRCVPYVRWGRVPNRVCCTVVLLRQHRQGYFHEQPNDSTDGSFRWAGSANTVVSVGLACCLQRRSPNAWRRDVQNYGTIFFYGH